MVALILDVVACLQVVHSLWDPSLEMPAPETRAFSQLKIKVFEGGSSEMQLKARNKSDILFILIKCKRNTIMGLIFAEQTLYFILFCLGFIFSVE